MVTSINGENDEERNNSSLADSDSFNLQTASILKNEERG